MAVNATAIWRVRPSGSDTNGGGFDSAISGAGTDYSQQNAAQATGTHGVTVGTAVFTDATASAFTSAMVGNAMYVTGTGQTTGWYFVVGYTSSSIVTLDRSPGTGTGATWNLGGGWATPDTNTTSSGPLVNGNNTYILGSGVPNPASYTHDYTISSTWTPTAGDSANGLISFLVDPATLGYKATPDTTGGMPVISINTTNGIVANYNKFIGLYFTVDASAGIVFHNGGNFVVIGCVADIVSSGNCSFCYNTGAGFSLFACEIFSSVPGNPGAAVNIVAMNQGCMMDSCNIHDLTAPYLGMANGGNVVTRCIFANSGTNNFPVISFSGISSNISLFCFNTIDGNTGDGLRVDNLTNVSIYSNIFSNMIGAAKTALLNNVSGNPDLSKVSIDYNSFYNNTVNYGGGFTAGPHDIALGSDPYVNSAIQDYRLK